MAGPGSTRAYRVDAPNESKCTLIFWYFTAAKVVDEGPYNDA